MSHAYAAENLSDQEAQQVVTELLTELQPIDFRDESIRTKLAKTNFRASEMLGKQTEIWKRDKSKYAKITDVPREEALKELQEEYLLASDMEGAFQQIKQNLKTLLPALIKADSTTTTLGKIKNADYYIDTIKTNKASFLIGAAYLQRNYNFVIKDNKNNKNNTVAHQLMTTNNAFGKEYSPLELVMQVGAQTADQRLMNRTPKLFQEVLGRKIADQTDLGAFLETQVTKAGYKPANWLWQTSKATIAEKPAKENPQATYRLFDKLKSDPTGQAEMLALLNVSENSLYVVSTVESIMYGLTDTYVNRALKDTAPDAYINELENFENQVEYAAERQADYWDFWYRIVKDDKRDKLVGNRRVWDNLQIKNPQENFASKRWSVKQGAGVASGVKEFITPLGYYFPFQQADGLADIQSGQINYWLANGLEDRGLTTYAHEHTHQLANEVHFAGYGQRSGASAELITRGIFEPWHQNDPTDKGAIFDLNQIFSRENQKSYSNETPARFQNPQDLKTYFHNQMDLIYTLDYLEAEVALAKEPTTKAKLFNKATLSGKNEVFSKITSAEATALKTINDLVDLNAVAYRLMVEGQKVTGTVNYNGYYSIPLFTPMYGAPHNPDGMSGDMHTKRLAWEMLSAYGYYEGMVSYLSNQLKPANTPQNTQFSDDVIIAKVSNGKYRTMAEFKKAQYAERIAKKDTLKAITIEWDGKQHDITSYAQLKDLMTAAVNDDLQNNGLLPAGWYSKLPTETQVEKLKSAIFLAYKSNTKQFADGIYKNTPQTYQVSYQFADFDNLPQEVKALLPATQSDIVAGSAVSPTVLQKKQVKTENGEYDFAGWNPEKVNSIAKNETFIGTWKFTPYAVPEAPTSSDVDFTESGNKYIGSYTLPDVAGVEYFVDGKVASGTVKVSANNTNPNSSVTVQVNARAKAGYLLKPSSIFTWKFKFSPDTANNDSDKPDNKPDGKNPRTTPSTDLGTALGTDPSDNSSGTTPGTDSNTKPGGNPDRKNPSTKPSEDHSGPKTGSTKNPTKPDVNKSTNTPKISGTTNAPADSQTSDISSQKADKNQELPTTGTTSAVILLLFASASATVGLLLANRKRASQR